MRGLWNYIKRLNIRVVLGVRVVCGSVRFSAAMSLAALRACPPVAPYRRPSVAVTEEHGVTQNVKTTLSLRFMFKTCCGQFCGLAWPCYPLMHGEENKQICF